MPENRKVLVGEITSAHGIRGAVKVYPFTDTPERFFTIQRIYIEGSDILRSVESVSIQKKMVLLKIEGIDTRNQSEILMKKKLLIPIEDRKPLEENQYFIEDLIGLSVYTTEKKKVGELVDILTEHANDVMVVQSSNGELLIPFVKAFVRLVSSEGIIIDPIEGMLE